MAETINCGDSHPQGSPLVFSALFSFFSGLLILIVLFFWTLPQTSAQAATPSRTVAVGIISRELNAIMTPLKIKGASKKATAYAKYIWEAHTKYGVDPFLVAALLCVESKGRADAKTKTCVGLMQISVPANMQWIPKHFPKIKTTKDLLKPRNNIMVGAFILAEATKGTSTPRQALFKYLGRRDEQYASKVLGIADRMRSSKK